jgi:hypothetical protein
MDNFPSRPFQDSVHFENPEHPLIRERQLNRPCWFVMNVSRGCWFGKLILATALVLVIEFGATAIGHAGDVRELALNSSWEFWIFSAPTISTHKLSLTYQKTTSRRHSWSCGTQKDLVIASSPAYHDHPPQRLLLNVPDTACGESCSRESRNDIRCQTADCRPTSRVLRRAGEKRLGP